MRDCDNCARCGRDGCKSWDCDFVPRKEAIEAWKEKHETADRKIRNCSEKPNNCEDEPQKHCHRPNNVACHPEQGDMWCRGCDYWYASEPQTERGSE